VSELFEASWDCHAHIIEDPRRYPLSPTRGYEPPLAPLDSYLALLDRLGIAHGLLVQPSVYGFDNSCLLDALDRAGGRLRGVAVPVPDSSARQLEAMHKRGVRGVRCNLLYTGSLAIDAVLRWQPILQELGWHVALHLAIADTKDLHSSIERLHVPVVIDHMGRPAPGHADPSAPGMQELVELVRTGKCFVKLSAPYRLSDDAPPWHDLTPLARAFLSACPERCLWATDWPHTDTADSVRDDDLLEALWNWCPDVLTRETVLATAPRCLGLTA
jgi:2-pyrone-4,6-dicarboxylate lactonase